MSQLTWQEKYAADLLQIENGYRTISRMRPIKEDLVRIYYDEFSLSNSHNSTAIEGITFSYDETKLILKEGMVFSNHSLQEHLEIKGYNNAFWFIYENIKNDKGITEDFVKHIHEMTLPGLSYAGTYRDIEVYVGDAFTDKVSYQPPSHTFVPELMKDYIAEVNRDLQNLKHFKADSKRDWNQLFHTLSAHHCAFERIHPFADGNGRVGRLLLNTEFIKLGLLPVDIRYAEKEHYYAALKKYDKAMNYSKRPESKTEGMAKLLASSEVVSIQTWLKMFSSYSVGDSAKLETVKELAAQFGFSDRTTQIALAQVSNQKTQKENPMSKAKLKSKNSDEQK